MQFITITAQKTRKPGSRARLLASHPPWSYISSKGRLNASIKNVDSPARGVVEDGVFGFSEARIKRTTLRFLVFLILCVSAVPAIGRGLSGLLPSLVNNLPPRARSAMTGSEFAKAIAEKHGRGREQAIGEQLIAGNMPAFLRQLRPVRLSGQVHGKTVNLTIFVTPDYLAVGSDADFLLTPMALHTALKVAAACDCILPTRKMVDAVFSQSDVHLTPEPMQAGPAMRTTAYYVTHNGTIQQQRRSSGATLTALISGHKKDVVLSNRLLHNPGRIAIYGWHRQSGSPYPAAQHGARRRLRRLQPRHPVGERHHPGRRGAAVHLRRPGRPGACRPADL